MNFKTGLAVAAAALAFGTASLAADDAPAAYPPLNDGTSVVLPAAHFKFQPSGAQGVTPHKSIKYSNVWGDVPTGPHGAFFLFDPGFKSYVHTHSHDYYAVVLKGTIQNYLPGQNVMNIGPGSYWYQRGLEKHTTACVSKEPCEIYIVQNAKFDAQNFPEEKN